MPGNITTVMNDDEEIFVMQCKPPCKPFITGIIHIPITY